MILSKFFNNLRPRHSFTDFSTKPVIIENKKAPRRIIIIRDCKTRKRLRALTINEFMRAAAEMNSLIVRALTINEFSFAAALQNSLIVRALRRFRVLQSLIFMTRRGGFLFSKIWLFVEFP